MNWFEMARKQIRSWSRRVDREERRRLPSLLAQVSESAIPVESIESAPNLTDLLKRSLGSRNPDLARGLSSLAILAMARGEFEEAESLLVRVLTIRKGTLGPFHPETIDTKERLESLRQLMSMNSPDEIPFELAEEDAESETEFEADALNPAEPSDVFEVIEFAPKRVAQPSVPESGLPLETEVFELADPAGVKPDPLPREVEPSARVVPTPPPIPEPLPELPVLKIVPSEGFQPVPGVGRVTEGLAEEIDELSEEFALLAKRMTDAATRLTASGELPPDDLIADIETARRDFERRRSRLRQGAIDLRLAPLSHQELASLGDLSRWLEAMVLSERREAEIRQIRSRAIETLNRALTLSHLEDDDFAPLSECQDRASELLESLSKTKALDGNDEAKQLADGNHPINDLLILVSRRKSLNDAEWGDLYGAVAKTYGGALAAAAVRGRLKIQSNPRVKGMATTPPAMSSSSTSSPTA